MSQSNLSYTVFPTQLIQTKFRPWLYIWAKIKITFNYVFSKGKKKRYLEKLFLFMPENFVFFGSAIAIVVDVVCIWASIEIEVFRWLVSFIEETEENVVRASHSIEKSHDVIGILPIHRFLKILRKGEKDLYLFLFVFYLWGWRKTEENLYSVGMREMGPVWNQRNWYKAPRKCGLVVMCRTVIGRCVWSQDEWLLKTASIHVSMTNLVSFSG